MEVGYETAHGNLERLRDFARRFVTVVEASSLVAAFASDPPLSFGGPTLSGPSLTSRTELNRASAPSDVQSSSLRSRKTLTGQGILQIPSLASLMSDINRMRLTVGDFPSLTQTSQCYSGIFVNSATQTIKAILPHSL